MFRNFGWTFRFRQKEHNGGYETYFLTTKYTEMILRPGWTPVETHREIPRPPGFGGHFFSERR